MQLSQTTIEALGKIITGDAELSNYRSGPKLVEFFNALGWSDEYGQGFPSRWMYTEDNIRHVNGEPVIEKIILKAIDPRDYIERSDKENQAVNYLNQYLEYDGHKLIKHGKSYSIEPLQNSIRSSRNIINIIFAANGPKPDIILSDAMDNNIEVVSNAKYCLIYDQRISPIHGLTLTQLSNWYYQRQTTKQLSIRLEECLDSEAEKLLFKAYYDLRTSYDKNFPALIPQVYLHYDPKTLSQLNGNKRLVRQRMDFLMLLPSNERIVFEVDGKHHYADGNVASTKKYAEMMKEDRRLQLSGYKIFRFGGHEFLEENAIANIQHFFIKLLDIYHIVPSKEANL